MCIETSDLNSGAALKSSNASLTGGTGDGNTLSLAELERGYTLQSAPARAPFDRIDLPYLLGDF